MKITRTQLKDMIKELIEESTDSTSNKDNYDQAIEIFNGLKGKKVSIKAYSKKSNGYTGLNFEALKTTVQSVEAGPGSVEIYYGSDKDQIIMGYDKGQDFTIQTYKQGMGVISWSVDGLQFKIEF